jgi:ATP-dependent RNA helicase DeaD
MLLLQLLAVEKPESALMFTNSRHMAEELCARLRHNGYNADYLTGDLPQTRRQRALDRLKEGKTAILVATDVAARGLDVDDQRHVINYGMPDDTESYTHRSGRTGRAGKKGTSISIVHTKEKHKIRNVERIIGKQFVEEAIPTAEEICKKQLYKVMDQIVKTDVNDDEIAPFIADINRYFQYIDKDEIIKKIVSLEFGKFLAYYADAPEIEKPVEAGRQKKEKSKAQMDREKRDNKPQKGYRRLFINLGRRDGFYPGVLMQTLNRYVGGRQEVGHIDLLDTISYFEVPERDARKVAAQLTGIRFKGRQVRCNDSEDGKNVFPAKTSERPQKPSRGEGRSRSPRPKDSWRDLMNSAPRELRGEEPDFSEDGWARRRPKKK